MGKKTKKQLGGSDVMILAVITHNKQLNVHSNKTHYNVPVYSSFYIFT